LTLGASGANPSAEVVDSLSQKHLDGDMGLGTQSLKLFVLHRSKKTRNLTIFSGSHADPTESNIWQYYFDLKYQSTARQTSR
jgi:hypothetical protein